MRYLVAILAGWLSLSGIALAHEIPGNLEVTASYDYYFTPNKGNNYEDGQGFSVGVTHPIWGSVSGRAEFVHITDISFPASEDPKGRWGELRGYGGFYDLMLDFPVNDNVSVYGFGGLGYFTWDFKENPFLQDNGVNVDVEDDLATRAGAGIDYKVKDDISLFLEAYWFDTDVPKHASNAKDGEWHIMGGDAIGLEYIGIKAGGKYRF